MTTAAHVRSVNRVADRLVSTTDLYRGSAGYSASVDFDRDASLSLNQTVSVLAVDDSLDARRRLVAIVNADMSGIAALFPRVSLSVAAIGQYSGSALVPSNQLFQIGGANSVRAFQPGSGSGASGALGQVELHYALPTTLSRFDLFAFFDAGKTFSRDFADRAIGATGIGLHATVRRFDLSATCGIAMGDRLPGDDPVRADLRLSYRF